MIDWHNTLVESEYRRRSLIEEARRDTVSAEYVSVDGGSPADAGRANVLGVLIAALVMVVITGAIAPR